MLEQASWWTYQFAKQILVIDQVDIDVGIQLDGRVDGIFHSGGHADDVVSQRKPGINSLEPLDRSASIKIYPPGKRKSSQRVGDKHPSLRNFGYAILGAGSLRGIDTRLTGWLKQYDCGIRAVPGLTRTFFDVSHLYLFFNEQTINLESNRCACTELHSERQGKKSESRLRPKNELVSSGRLMDRTLQSSRVGFLFIPHYSKVSDELRWATRSTMATEALPEPCRAKPSLLAPRRKKKMGPSWKLPFAIFDGRPVGRCLVPTWA